MRRSHEVPTEQSHKKPFNPFAFLLINMHVDKWASKQFCNQLLDSVLQELKTTTHVAKNEEPPDWPDHALLLPELCPSHAQALRMKLVLDWNKIMREIRAAVRIQANYRRHRQRNLFIAEIYRRYVAQMTRPAIVIQREWRRFKAMRSAKLYAFAQHVQNVCRAKARRIAGKYKGIIIQGNVRYYLLVKVLNRPMDPACTKIQAVFKGHYARKLFRQILEYERRYKSVKWVGAGSEVEVMGDMTDPPWIARLQMDYCKLRRIFVKYFAKLRSGVYYYNYVVDGDIRVAREFPVAEHLGSECNVLSVIDESKPKVVLNIPRAFSKDYTDGNTGWSELRRICSESSMELLKQQPVFQTAGEVVESSGEYDLLNALKYAKTPKDEPPPDLAAATVAVTAPAEEIKLKDPTEEEKKRLRKPFAFEDIRANEPILIREMANIMESSPHRIIEEKKESSSELAGEAKEGKGESGTIKPEDKFAGGRAEINFDLAYDYENYYS